MEQSKNDFSSLDGQESQCRSWVSNKKQHEIIGVYKDAKSGKDLTRPGIERLLLDAKAKKFDLIVVSKLDRISRSLSDFLKLVEKLDSFGVDIAVTTQDIDTSTPAGKALQRMMLVFAEFERDMIADRTREKRIETLKAGLWQGGNPPLGYDVEHKKLCVNEEEAETVREIFQRYLKEKSSSVVVKSLNKDGFVTKIWKTRKGKIKGGAKFEKNGLLRILKSRLYLGEYEYEDKIYPGKHDPIIETEVFHAVQEIIRQNSSDPKGYFTGNSPAKLAGISYCGLCSSSLTTTSTKKSSGQQYFYYKCVKKNKEGKTESHSPKDLPVHTLDNFVAFTMSIMLEQPELLKAFRKRNKFEGDVAEKDLSEKIKRLENRLKGINKDITNTVTYLTKNPPDSTENLLQDKLNVLNLEKEEVANELELCIEELNRLKNQKPVKNSGFKRILKEFYQRWEDKKFEEREVLLKTIVRRVESTVKTDNSGSVEVKYVADKKLEAEWAEIKNANSEKIKVRTSGIDSSPGRIRTYDRSVNSRLLCH